RQDSTNHWSTSCPTGRRRNLLARHHGAVAEFSVQPDDTSKDTFYDAVGGEPTFVKLVNRFYREVAADEILRPMYPEEDLTGAEERLRLFLIQYWGGPTTYSQQRGHPRLRMRHVPYTIGPIERDAWLRCM